MPSQGDISGRHAKLRRVAETRLAEAPSEGGFWYSIADCQRMVHELHVYEIELDLLGEQLTAQQNGLQALRKEVQGVQKEFREIAETVIDMEDGPEKAQIGIQCLHTTLHLFEERFKLLALNGRVQAP